MGSLSGSKSRSKNSMSQEVWGAQSPFLQDLYRRGADLVNQFQPQQFDMGNTMQAYNQQINPQMNPHLGAMTQQYTQALGQLDNASGAQAAQAGVFGGGRQGVEQHLNQQNIGNQLGNFLGGQYQSDMNRSAQTLGMAPQLQQMQFMNNPYTQQQSALQGYAGMIGGPTTLASSSGKGKSGSFGLSIK
jgi:hypothetical protein